MAAKDKKKVSRVREATSVGIGMFVVVFLIYLFTDMGFVTFLKWSIGLGLLGFLWELIGIGKLLDALQAGGMGQ